MPLRDHLGADEDVDLTPSHAVEHPGALVTRGHIAIQTSDPRARQRRRDEALDAFGACTLLRELRLAAVGTSFGHVAVVITVVANETRRPRAVEGERNGTARALHNLAARLAHE